MESKSLLYGIIGFIAGGLIVAIAASVSQPNHDDTTHDSMDMAMTSMTATLRTGDFIRPTMLFEKVPAGLFIREHIKEFE